VLQRQSANPIAPVVPQIRGWWCSGSQPPIVGEKALIRAVFALDKPVQLVQAFGRLAVAEGGQVVFCHEEPAGGALPIAAFGPPINPANLGDPDFRSAHKLRYAYIAGAMANGIGSAEIVEAMARSGMIGFFGAAGLPLDRIETAIDRIQHSVGHRPYGFNLIHSPGEPEQESAVVDLYLRRQVRLVSASAYLGLTLPLIKYRVSGVFCDTDGTIVAPNRVIAKVSREEVARKFFAPPPDDMLAALVQQGAITQQQAQLAARIPVADDLTAEADSGGHTDNRPALTLLPTMMAVRDEAQARYGYPVPLRVGAAGGIATPQSAAAAFAMGAAYVLTGSINQACVEAGTSQSVREMLAQASQADVIMAPAADMFEMGVKVQVLKWGTMFAVRARKLYDLYRAHASLDEIPASQRAILERDFFKTTLEEAWSSTREFFATRDPAQNTRAERDPKHKMALVFRAYLGQSSDWANRGEPSRKADYQVWCGPAMGAFNEWAKGSFLEGCQHRDVVTLGLNLMVGAAILTRVASLRAQGAALPAAVMRIPPRPRGELETLLDAIPHGATH
jgi:trans-AT polyketide synthase, acyltransferase and oxidoreductase domains